MVLFCFFIQILQKLQHLKLMRHVQIGGWLIQKDERRILGKGHGDPGPLPLSSGERVHIPAGKLLHIRNGERPVNGLMILFFQPPEPSLMGISAVRHQLFDRQAPGA